MRAAGRQRSGAERRARTSAAARPAAAQNGTSGVLPGCKHARRQAAWGTPRAGSEVTLTGSIRREEADYLSSVCSFGFGIDISRPRGSIWYSGVTLSGMG